MGSLDNQNAQQLHGHYEDLGKAIARIPEMKALIDTYKVAKAPKRVTIGKEIIVLLDEQLTRMNLRRSPFGVSPYEPLSIYDAERIMGIDLTIPPHPL
ncbi:MAG: hypothetical protein AAB899_01065 [Patescibacteria group bacterium]